MRQLPVRLVFRPEQVDIDRRRGAERERSAFGFHERGRTDRAKPAFEIVEMTSDGGTRVGFVVVGPKRCGDFFARPAPATAGCHKTDEFVNFTRAHDGNVTAIGLHLGTAEETHDELHGRTTFCRAE